MLYTCDSKQGIAMTGKQAPSLAPSVSGRVSQMMQWVQTPGEIYLTSVAGLLRWIRLVRAFLRRRRMQRALGL